MDRDNDAATQPLLNNRPAAAPAPADPAAMADNKYGTFAPFARLFGTNKQAAPAASDTQPPPASTPPATDASRKRCIRISLIVMISSSVILAVGLLAGLLTRHGANASVPADGGNSTTPGVGDNSTTPTARPNIVFIMTDDQDKRLGSTDYMPVLQREIIEKGAEFSNHYTTQALCCPARSSLFRGQQIHNTNITNVIKPGGTYNKWVLSQQDQNYLPYWLSAAGYKTEYIGKIMNGYGISNYATKPAGWDHVDALCEPFIDDYNVPVWSANGATPQYYPGWHQTDVHRLKVLDRLDNVTAQADPFFFMITPFTPHVAYEQANPSSRPIPLQRYMDSFLNLTAPQTPNFNPSDEIQQGSKSGWVQYLTAMNTSAIEFADFVYQSRIQALQGVDEIIEDVIAKLDEKGVLNNTYIIYTSDNGYHLGQHRVPGGKSLFYNEDTNIPFAVRGPNVPAGTKSTLPSLHLDLAPTFLEIAGVAEADFPVFFDGSSVLSHWHNPGTGTTGTGAGDGNSRESMNIEYWGLVGIEAPSGPELGGSYTNNTYKTIRVVGDVQNWAYAVWCNGQTELYNITADPYELTNLARGDDISETHQRVINRLNALLMVTKSCEQDRCRNPWAQLVPDNSTTLVSLVHALDEAYDTFFDDFEKVTFSTCMEFQWTPAEEPYFPALDTLPGGGLGRAYREETIVIAASPGIRTVITTPNYYGTLEQRNATMADLVAVERDLTAAEISAVIGA